MRMCWSAIGWVLLLTSCSVPSKQQARMEGDVVIAHPDGPPTTVHVSCSPVIDYQANTVNVTGVQVPITSVIKPQVGGVTTGVSYRQATDAIAYLDYNQFLYCEALLLAASAQDRKQVFDDYVKATGDLTTAIRALETSSSPQQYQQNANQAAQDAAKPPSPVTTTAVNELKSKTGIAAPVPTAAAPAAAPIVPAPATPTIPTAPPVIPGVVSPPRT
jgi:hypothetical protein